MKIICLIFTNLIFIATTYSMTKVPYLDVVEHHKRIIQALPEYQGKKIGNFVRIRPEYLNKIISREYKSEKEIFNEYKKNVEIVHKGKVWSQGHQKFINELKIDFINELKEEGIIADPWNEPFDRKYLKELPFYPSSRNFKVTTGYSYGKSLPRQKNGKEAYSFKLFLTFKNSLNDLSPKMAFNFAKELSENGVSGAFKFIMITGYMQVYMNNLIMYASNIDEARKAEKIALEFFQDKLRHTSRGVDGSFAFTNYEGRIWPDLVSTLPSIDILPRDVQEFLEEPLKTRIQYLQ